MMPWRSALKIHEPDNYLMKRRELSMAGEEKTKNVGTVLISLLAGALLGAGIAFLMASQKEESEDSGYEEADLFV